MPSFLSYTGIQEALVAIPFKDVLVNAVGGFLGAAFLLWLTLGWDGIKAIKSKFRRPTLAIEVKRAPKNIFAAIELESSAAWILQHLGHPNKIRGNWWGYRFSDALVSMQFDENMALETLAVALVDDDSTFIFPTIHFDCPPLGKAMLSNVLSEHLQLEYVHSLRHSELLISGREGPNGAWHYITFGALDPHAPGMLLSSEFQWDVEKECLITPEDKIKINWAAISTRSGPASFPWDFGLRLQSY